MQKLKKVGLIILICVTLSGCIVAYTKFYFIPTYKKIVFSKVNIDKYNKIIQSMNVNIFLNQKESNKLKVTNAKFKNALKGLPQSERNPEIVRSILNFGEISGAVVKKVSFGEFSEVGESINTEIDCRAMKKNDDNKIIKKEKLVLVPLELSLSGDYIKIKKFINLLEDDKRIVQIDNISISNSNEEIKDKTVQAVLNIVYYYFNSSVKREEPYDFCNKSYGKEDIFK